MTDELTAVTPGLPIPHRRADETQRSWHPRVQIETGQRGGDDVTETHHEELCRIGVRDYCAGKGIVCQFFDTKYPKDGERIAKLTVRKNGKPVSAYIDLCGAVTTVRKRIRELEKSGFFDAEVNR